MYTPRKVKSIVLLIAERGGHLLVKPASDGTHGRIVHWESIGSKPVFGKLNKKDL